MRPIARLAAIATGLVVVLALLWAAAVFVAPVPQADTPRDTVLRYYRLVGQSRDAEAIALTGLGTDANTWTDLSAEHGLFNLSVDGGQRTDSKDPIASGYLDPVVFEVTFVQFGATDTQGPGPQHWFVAVGRPAPGAPWRIAQIASGW